MALNSKDSFQNIFTREPWIGQDIFADATLKTEDGYEFRVHKIMLTHKSKYFKGLFSHASESEKNNGISIKEIDGTTLGKILLYVYSGDAEFSTNNVWNILIASDYFLMDDLVNKGWSFAMEHLPEKCLEALSIAETFQRLSTTTEYYRCYRHLIVHFDEIVKANNIGIVPLNTFKTILNHNSLNVTSEDTVWKAVVSWVEVDKFERLENIEELLKFIRLQEEVDDSLASNILSSDLVKNNPYLPHQNLTKQKNSLFPDFYNFTLGPDILLSHPRRPKQLHYIIDNSASTNLFEGYLSLTYDEECDFARKICRVKADKIVTSGQHLWLFYTISEGEAGFSYNIVNESLTPLQLPEHRSGYSVVAIGDNVYIIGTHIGDTMYCYHTSLETWIPITIPENIDIFNAVSLNGSIYMLGWEEENILSRNICLIYKPENNSWSVTYPTSFIRHEFTTVPHNGKIYNFETSSPQNVEEYNPENRMWTKLPPLPLKFNDRDIKAISIGDTLIVSYFSDFTQLDINSNSWIDVQVTETLRNLQQFEFCTVDDSEIIDDLTRKNRRIGVQWEKL